MPILVNTFYLAIITMVINNLDDPTKEINSNKYHIFLWLKYVTSTTIAIILTTLFFSISPTVFCSLKKGLIPFIDSLYLFHSLFLSIALYYCHRQLNEFCEICNVSRQFL